MICTTIIEISSNCCNFTDFWARAVFLTPKVAFWKAWMKNKVTTHQNKEERIEKIELVSYRSNTGKGKGRIWERSYFEEIQVKFYQLFATVIRWSLWKFEKKLPNLSFDWRERGRKEEKRAVLQRNSQKVTKIWNLSDFQQIQVKFYQLFARVIRWSLWKFEKKITKFIVRLTRERKKGRKSHTLAEIAKKLKKSNALYIKKPE